MNHRTAAALYLLAMVTYTQHVKPILDSHCIECHSTGNALNLSRFPFSSKTSNDQSFIVDMMLAKVEANPPVMPPGIRPKLNANEINVLQQWRDEGLEQ